MTRNKHLHFYILILITTLCIGCQDSTDISFTAYASATALPSQPKPKLGDPLKDFEAYFGPAEQAEEQKNYYTIYGGWNRPKYSFTVLDKQVIGISISYLEAHERSLCKQFLPKDARLQETIYESKDSEQLIYFSKTTRKSFPKSAFSSLKDDEKPGEFSFNSHATAPYINRASCRFFIRGIQ